MNSTHYHISFIMILPNAVNSHPTISVNARFRHLAGRENGTLLFLKQKMQKRRLTVIYKILKCSNQDIGQAYINHLNSL